MSTNQAAFLNTNAEYVRTRTLVTDLLICCYLAELIIGRKTMLMAIVRESDGPCASWAFLESISRAIAAPPTSVTIISHGCYRDSNCCPQLFARRRLRGREIDHEFRSVTLENVRFLWKQISLQTSPTFDTHEWLLRTTPCLTFHSNRNKLLSIIMSIVRRVIHCGGTPTFILYKGLHPIHNHILYYW